MCADVNKIYTFIYVNVHIHTKYILTYIAYNYMYMKTIFCSFWNGNFLSVICTFVYKFS